MAAPAGTPPDRGVDLHAEDPRRPVFLPRPAPPRRALPVGSGARRCVQITIGGIVQGVGFRPYVHRLAVRHGLDGWVRNEAGAVRVMVQGSPDAVSRFLITLPADLPPLARIDTLDVAELDESRLAGFEVVSSDTHPRGRLPVSPDVALCPACEKELYDLANRRHGYPFITCTDCGPRFTVIESMPYDRTRTSMGAFTQCPECEAEYRDPADRRFHSETNSCWQCGPTVWLEEADPQCTHQARVTGPTGIAVAGALLKQGAILAVRGLGGFHLAVDARNEEAVQRLRERKGRDAKPLAVMVRHLDQARRLANVSDAEAQLLESRQRPIVVLKRRAECGLASTVSPGLDTVGIMLAYTPLHHLLISAAGGRPLVMTSGNLSEEPIATGNAEARLALGGIADAFLLHDREIVARYDDSLLRVTEVGPVVLRRARGYAPLPVPVPVEADDAILAMGPHLKNTFTLVEGSDAYVSQHVGDLENLETLSHFQSAQERLQGLFRIRPRWVVRDLHPGYLSTRLAQESGLEELPPVQHHHAHVAAVLGEHGRTGPVLGLAFDGTGYGDDGRVWGCEFLEADLTGYRRLAHLRYAPLPGGDRAARTPWRALLGYASLDVGSVWAAAALAPASGREVDIAMQQARRGVNAPLASSLGRLFDAAAAALGIRLESSYEGQAAMELESIAGSADGPSLPFPQRESSESVTVLDPLPLLEALVLRRRSGVPVEALAAGFHEAVVDAVARTTATLCDTRRIDVVALGGGCFQNGRLLSGLVTALTRAGLDVLVPKVLSPNDGSVSYGQAVVASARLSA